MAALNDSRFVRRIVRKDVAAFEQLYDAFSPVVFGHLLQRASSAELAEKMLVETFYRAWSQVRTFPGERSSLTQWLLRIAGDVLEEEIPILRTAGSRAA